MPGSPLPPQCPWVSRPQQASGTWTAGAEQGFASVKGHLGPAVTVYSFCLQHFIYLFIFFLQHFIKVESVLSSQVIK